MKVDYMYFSAFYFEVKGAEICKFHTSLLLEETWSGARNKLPNFKENINWNSSDESHINIICEKCILYLCTVHRWSEKRIFYALSTYILYRVRPVCQTNQILKCMSD